MTGKDKFIYIILSIFTLGLYPILIKKNKNDKVNKELSVAKKITVNVQKLQDSLGGSENVAGVEHTYTKIKIFVKDRNLVNISEIEKMKGISGLFAGAKYVTIIVGNQAKELSQKI